MADIQEKIGKLCPEAQCDASGEFLLISVPDAQWHDLAQSLKDELHFDYLTALVGVDWKEELGVMYYLTNTETQEMIHVKDITKVTGYVRGGCSPLGMKKQYVTTFHQTARDIDTIMVSAGRIGYQIALAPSDLVALAGGQYADIVRE